MVVPSNYQSTSGLGAVITDFPIPPPITRHARNNTSYFESYGLRIGTSCSLVPSWIVATKPIRTGLNPLSNHVTVYIQSYNLISPWWRHQMETFSALRTICAGNSPVPGDFPTQRPVTRSFDVYFDLRPSKRFSKQSWGWCFMTSS